jgi:RNA polymerase sigma-70 factor (ECF subfamily)
MVATPDPLKATTPAVLDDLDDAALVRKSLAGEAEAFAMLIRRHERRVFALASAGLGGPARRADVEDCAQECLLAGYRGLGALRKPEEFGPWLLGIAKNQIRQSLKRRGRRRESTLPEGLQAPEAPDGGGEDILEALARLPEPEREAVALRHLTGHSPAEIAQALGLPDGTVRSRISRGLERLRGILGKERIP